MKLSFFTAALIGLLGGSAQAIQVQQVQQMLAAQTYAQSDSVTHVDANCEETVNGVTLKLQTPECQQKTAEEPKVNFENQMLLALQDLSGKSMDLYDALKLQFAKNAKLSEGTPMAISGQVIVKPKIDSDPTEGAAFLKAADVKPAGNSDAATITIRAEGAGVKVDGADAKPAEKKAEDKKADAKPADKKVDKKADDKKADDAAKPAADKK